MPEVEVFYTFTWGGNRSRREGGGGERRNQSGRPKGKQGGKPGGKPKGRGQQGNRPQKNSGARVFSSKPDRKDKIDPDNPFAAALMGLKGKE